MSEEDKNTKPQESEKKKKSLFDDDFNEEGLEEEPQKEESKEDSVEKPEEKKEEIKIEEPKAPEAKKELPKKPEKKKKNWAMIFLVALLIILFAFLGVLVGYKFFSVKDANETEETTTTTTKVVGKTTITTKASEEENVVFVTAEGGLNLREEASQSSQVIETMPFGSELTVLDESDDWYKVEYGTKTGWCAKLYTSADSPTADWATYAGSGFDPNAAQFSINYPSSWTLEGYKVSTTVNDKKYSIALGEGGHGLGSGEDDITSTSEDKVYNGVTATRITAKRDGVIFFIAAQFKNPNGVDTTSVEMFVPEGYDANYINIFDMMLETFSFN